MIENRNSGGFLIVTGKSDPKVGQWDRNDRPKTIGANLIHKFFNNRTVGRRPRRTQRIVIIRHHHSNKCVKQAVLMNFDISNINAQDTDANLVGWLCFKSHRRRGQLETAPPFTVPCEGREPRFLNRSHWESNSGLSRGSPLHYRSAQFWKMQQHFVSYILDMNVQSYISYLHMLNPYRHLDF